MHVFMVNPNIYLFVFISNEMPPQSEENNILMTRRK